MTFPEYLHPLLDELLLTLVGLFATLIIGLLVDLALAARQWMKTTLSNGVMSTLEELAGIAARSVDQDALAGRIDDVIDAKRDAAIDRLQQLARRHGLGFIDMDDLLIALESALRKGLHKRTQTERCNAGQSNFLRLRMSRSVV